MSTENHTLTTKSARTAMDKHIQFWDHKNKGYITPVDAVFGFIHLGYGIVISVTLGTFIGMIFSYTTQDSWMPDPLCRTRVEKWRKKDNSCQVYEEDGKLNSERFDELFMKYAKSDISGNSVTIKELLEWNEATYKDPLAWSSTALQWLALYLLVGNKGVVKKQDIQAVYDGTFFYQVRDRNKASRSIQSVGDNNSSSSSSSSINISGIQVPKSYIQQLEARLTKAVHALPHPTVSLLETRLQHWLNSTKQHRQVATSHDNDNSTNGMKPILKGVATPSPIRRSLFSNSSDGDNDTTEDPFSVDHKIGVAANDVDQSMMLSGVQGYKLLTGGEYVDNGGEPSLENNKMTMNDDTGIDNYFNVGIDYNNGVSFSMTGVRSEEKEDIDWLQSGQLTGVTPTTSVVSNLADQENNNSNSIGDGNSNEDDKEETTSGKESVSLDGIQAEATPPLTENGSVASDLDDIANYNLEDYGGNDLTKQTDLQHNDNTDIQHNNNADIPHGSDADNQHIENAGNNGISNGNKSSSGKKNKKNKKKKNRQQQTPSPTPTLPAKDYNVDEYRKEQAHGQSLSCKNLSIPPFTGSSSSQDDDDNDDLPSSPSAYSASSPSDPMKKNALIRTHASSYD